MEQIHTTPIQNLNTNISPEINIPDIMTDFTMELSYGFYVAEKLQNGKIEHFPEPFVVAATFISAEKTTTEENKNST